MIENQQLTMRAMTIILTFLFTACAGSMANIQGGACEAGCDQAKDTCFSECKPPEPDPSAGPTEVSKDNWEGKAACELACEQAREKCVTDCKE